MCGSVCLFFIWSAFAHLCVQLPSLQDILDDAELRSKLIDFATSKYQEEGPLFWQAVHKYKNAKGAEEKRAISKTIKVFHCIVYVTKNDCIESMCGVIHEGAREALMLHILTF